MLLLVVIMSNVKLMLYVLVVIVWISFLWFGMLIRLSMFLLLSGVYV